MQPLRTESERSFRTRSVIKNVAHVDIPDAGISFAKIGIDVGVTLLEGGDMKAVLLVLGECRSYECI